jgi:FAD/FMN-containing dehydrogenase
VLSRNAVRANIQLVAALDNLTIVLDTLRALVGRDHVLTGDDTRRYCSDWTGRYRGVALAVVRPASTAECAAVVTTCVSEGVPVVPQGGNTGLVGGGTPDSSGRAVVVSTERMRSVTVDALAGQVTAGAGVVLAALQEAMAGTVWEFGVDLGARGSCTVGGMIATNAGGTRVLRYGSMRAQVVGVEAVLGDGAVVSRLDGLVKDNTGYDLGALLTGSEGTLGIVTAARLRLVPRPESRVTVLAALPSLHDALALSARLRATVDGLDSIEAVLGDGLDLVCEQAALRAPFAATPNVTMLAEWTGTGEPPTSFVEAFAELDHLVALDAGGRERLWAYRERMTESINRVGVPHKLDVTLPFGRLAAFVDALSSTTAPHRTYVFGHLGDGNLHVNVLGPSADDHRVDDAVLALVIEHGGSISAEHGIGRMKAHALGLQRSAAELKAFRAIKHALDPAGIMNPGVLLTD